VADGRRSVNAIVLAGGAPDAVAALQPGAPNKAFVRVGGRPLVTRVLHALRATARIERIVVVAPPASHRDPALAEADERRPDGARMIQSLESGLAGAPPDELLLVAASDLALLVPPAIDEFLDLALERELDLVYAIVAKRVHDARYRRVPHTWAAMREGRYCGGGLVLLRPRVLPALRNVIDELGAARKSPLRLAALFGWDILLRFAFGLLPIAAAERRAGAILHAAAGAVSCTHPEIAVNVDRPGDVALVNGLLGDASKST
jgi:GTP:adenosylcobinamide-phosphate guanylyltransferase